MNNWQSFQDGIKLRKNLKIPLKRAASKIDSVKIVSTRPRCSMKHEKAWKWRAVSFCSKVWRERWIRSKIVRELSVESFPGEKYHLEQSLDLQRKGEFNFDRTNKDDKRRRERKKERDKVFLLHQLFNFAIPCLVILNRVTSDELSIREPFVNSSASNDVFEAEPYKMEQTHVFESSFSSSLLNVSSFRSDEIFLYP